MAEEGPGETPYNFSPASSIKLSTGLRVSGVGTPKGRTLLILSCRKNRYGFWEISRGRWTSNGSSKVRISLPSALELVKNNNVSWPSTDLSVRAGIHNLLEGPKPFPASTAGEGRSSQDSSRTHQVLQESSIERLSQRRLANPG